MQVNIPVILQLLYLENTAFLLKSAKRVNSITEVAEVLQSVTKLDFRVNFFKVRTNK